MTETMNVTTAGNESRAVWWRALWRALVARLTRRAEPLSTPTTLPPLPLPTPIIVDEPAMPLDVLPPLMPAPKKRAARAPKPEKTGTYYYFDNLLDQLPKCRQLMRRLRAVDRDAYDYNARMGARIMPDYTSHEFDLPQAFIETLPGAGMVFIPPSTEGAPPKKKERYDGVFTYFQKLTKRPWNMVVPSGAVAAVYRCVCVYVSHNKKAATGATFAVALVDGIPRLISERIVEQSKAGFYSQRWGYPPNLEWWHTHGRAALMKEPHGKERADLVFGDTVQDFAAILFTGAARQYTMSAGDNFQVRAERDNISVGFSVAVGRTPYFFKDRDRAVNVNGATRRIFHQVDAHERTLANGKTTTVKTHYRGMRRFSWKGENVVITSPDWSPFTINVAAMEFQEDEKLPNGEYWTNAKTAGALRDFLEADSRADRVAKRRVFQS